MSEAFRSDLLNIPSIWSIQFYILSERELFYTTITQGATLGNNYVHT